MTEKKLTELFKEGVKDIVRHLDACQSLEESKEVIESAMKGLHFQVLVWMKENAKWYVLATASNIEDWSQGKEVGIKAIPLSEAIGDFIEKRNCPCDRYDEGYCPKCKESMPDIEEVT